EFDEQAAGFGDVREGFDALLRHGVEGFWDHGRAHVTDYDVGIAGFHALIPAFIEAARRADQRDDGRNADGDAAHGQAGADRASQKAAQNDGNEGHEFRLWIRSGVALGPGEWM